ncbi:MAG TPA: hypothetical protein VIJ22_12535 [Polyangiaceae bacterium]
MGRAGRRAGVFALLVVAASGESFARAEEPRATLSVGVLELLPPTTVSLTTEVALGRHFSIAGMTGVGVRSLSGGGTTPGWTEMLTPRWYPHGHLADGLHLDLMLAYARAVEGSLQGDLQPPAGLSFGEGAGYEARPFPAPVVLGIELGLLHLLWAAPEGGAVPWLQPWGDVTAGLAF